MKYRLTLAAVLVALMASLSAAAQDPDTPVSSEVPGPGLSTEVPTVTESPAFEGVERTRVGEPVPPPRTMRAYWHVFIAFAVTWLLLFGYALSLGRRWARLEREVIAMRRDTTGV